MVRLLVLLLLPLLAQPTWAHDVPPSLLMLDIGKASIDVELQMPVNELGSALQLPLAEHAASILKDHGERIAQYVSGRLQLTGAGGQPLVAQLQQLASKRTDNPYWNSNDWVLWRARFTLPPSASPETFILNSTVIIEQVVTHKSMVYVRHDVRNGLVGNEPMLIGVLGAGQTDVAVDGSQGSWSHGLAAVFRVGMRHIASGTDHLLFLLVLLLPAVSLVRAGRWEPGKPLAASLRAILWVVTGFTLGHSLTLALASAGLVSVPTRPVEVLIAVSILVSAIHAWRPLFAGREVFIAAFFGLIHGLAFAEVLAGLQFDSWSLIVSLLGFNLGIEVMQALVVLTFLPMLLWATSTAWQSMARRVGAALAGIAAVAWIVERLFDLPDPLQRLSVVSGVSLVKLASVLSLASTLALAAWLARRRRPGAQCDAISVSN
jgi:hypothetical protein